MRRYLGTLLLGTFLAAPVLVLADEHDKHDANRVERYYDPDAKQWHEWNESENKAYHEYWEQNRKDRDKDFRDFKKLNKKERSDYWRWRHEHQDVR